MEQEAAASQYYQARSKQAAYGSPSTASGRESASGLRSNAADSSARSERYTQGNSPSKAQRAHPSAQHAVYAEDVSQLQPARVQSPQRGHDSRKATNGQQQYQPRRQRSYLPDADQSDGRLRSCPLIKDDRSQPLVSTSAKVAAHLRGGLTGASELDAMMTSGNDTMGNTEVFDPHALAAAAINTTNTSSAVFTPPVSSDQSAKHISSQQQSLRSPQAEISRSNSGARGSSPGARGSSPGAQRSSLGARGSSQGARRSSPSTQGARGSSPGAGGVGVGYSSPGAHRGSSVSARSSPGQQQQGPSPASPPRRQIRSPPGPERKGSPSVVGRMHHTSPQPQPSAESQGSPACRQDSSTGASSTYKRAQSYSTRERVGTQNTSDLEFSPARQLSSHSSQREQELTAAADAAAHAWDGGIAAARLAAHNAQSSRDSASQRTPLPPSGRSVAPAMSASRRGASPPAPHHGNDPEPPSVPRSMHAPHAQPQRAPSARAPGAYLKQGSRARMEDYHQSGGEEDGSTGVGSRQSITAAIPPSLRRSDSRSRAAQNSTSNSSAQHAEHAPHAQEPALQASHIRMVPQVHVGHAHAEAPEATMPQQPQSPPSFPTYNMLDVSEDNSVTADTAALLRNPNDRAVVPPWADDGQRRSAPDVAHPSHHQPTHAQQTHAPVPLLGAPGGHPRPPSPPPHATHAPTMHAHHAHPQNMSPPQSQPKMYAPPVDRIAGGKAHPHAHQMHAVHASSVARLQPQIQQQQHFPAPHPGTDSSIATVPYDAVEVGGGVGGASSSRPNTQSTIPYGDVMRPSTVMTIPNDNETRPGTISVQMPGTASTVPYNDAPESPVARPHTAATVQYSPPPTVDPIIAGMHVAAGGSAAASADGSSESPADIARRAARRRGPHPANPTAIAMEKQSAAEAALFARPTPSHLPQAANNPQTVELHASASGSAGGGGEPGSTPHPHGGPQHGGPQQQPGVHGSPIRQQLFDTHEANGAGDRPMHPGALESMEGSDMHSLHAYTHHTKATVMTAPVAAAFDDGASGASGPHGHSSNACSTGIDGGSSAVFGTPTAHTNANGHISDYPLSGITSPGADGATGRRNVKQAQYSQRNRPLSAGAASTISDAPRFIPPHSPRGAGGGGGGYKYDSQGTLPERMSSYQMSTADYSGNAVLNGATPGWIPTMGGPSQAELSPAGDVSTGTTRPGVGPGWFTPPPGPGAQPTVSSTAQPQDSGGAMHAAHATGNGSGQFDHSSRVMSDAAPGLDYAEAGPSFRGDTAEGAHASGPSDFHPRAASHASSVHGPSRKHASHASQHQYSGYTHSGAPVGSYVQDTAYAHSSSHPGSSMTDYQVGTSQKSRVTHHEQPPGDVTCMELMYRPRVVVYMAIFIAVLLLIIIILFVALFAA